MKRFTERRGDSVRYTEGRYEITCYPKDNNLSDIDKMAVRLCELEDKIESEQLVELPIPLQKTYFHLYQKGTKYEKKVWVIRKVSLSTLAYALLSGYKDWTDIFLTRAQAEARLKELKEGL